MALLAWIDWWYVIAIAGTAVCALTLTMTMVNLRGVYRRSPNNPSANGLAKLSVCIPARNEEANIEGVVRSLLANGHPDFEVVVVDDGSTDRTPEILEALASKDERVRPVRSEPLPAGWVGKQWACMQAGEHARGEWLLFTDADVRFSEDALSRAHAEALRLKTDLLSTVPRQELGTWIERAVVPMIHFLLLSYLPMPRMRTTREPGTSAGCGQFLLISREAYGAIDGHGAFKDSMHDGIKMPRAVRGAGFHSDLFDGTDLCACRMYFGLRSTWRGFAKNAYEGLGAPALLVFLTVIHALGHAGPWALLPLALLTPVVPAGVAPLALASIVCALWQRTIIARRMEQPMSTVALHPIGVLLMTLIQWDSFVRHLRGARSWRGRSMGEADAIGV
ncbi:MAG: glycosyltransferase family 2 protein [Planctomycetota bacterium]